MRIFATSVALAAFASIAWEPVDPFTIWITRTDWTPPATSDIKRLKEERGAEHTKVLKARDELAKALRKQHGGKVERWPTEAQEQYWDSAEAALDAAARFRELIYDTKDYERTDTYLGEEIAKRKAFRLVTSPDEADLVIEVVSPGRLKMRPGGRLGPLPADRLNQTMLREDTGHLLLSLEHRYKPEEPFWIFSGANLTFAYTLVEFLKANGELLRVARRPQ